MIVLPSSAGIYRPFVSSVPTPTVYWEADFGIVTTTNGTTADASPVSGNKVLSWTSKDASASVASYGTNANRPTYFYSGAGKPFVRFDGQQGQLLTATGPAATFNNIQAYSMGVAFRAAPIYAPGQYRNQQYLTLDNNALNTNTLHSQGTMQFGFWTGNMSQRVLLSNNQQLWGETTLFGTYSTASSTSTPAAQSTKVYTGGTLAVSDTTSTAGVSPCYAIVIGYADSTAGYSTICDYYGVYLYNSELNATQISAVHNNISSRFFTYATLPVSGAALWLDGSRPSSLWDTTALGSNVYTNGGAIGQWNDLSGNSRNATQTNSTNRPTWASPNNGRNGLGAVAFNGSQLIGSSFSSPLNFGTSDFTVECWIKPSSFSGNNILLYSGSGGFLLYFSSAGLFKVANWGVGDYIVTSSSISTSAWTHIAVTRAGTTLRLFLNGTLANTVTNNASFSASTFLLGWDNNASNPKYVGQIQNLLIYNGQALYTSNFTPWMS